MRQIWAIASYEVLHIFKDRILTLMVFFVPILYALLFGTVYASGILTNIPLGIVDLDHSSLSREVADIFTNNQYFQVIPRVATYPELQAAMKTGAVRAGIVIPADFEKRVSEHQLSKALLIYDSSNLIWGYNIRRYARTLTNQFYMTHAAAYLSGLGFAGKNINNILDTVSLNMEIWYNPSLNYCNFLFAGLLLMIIHQIGLMGVSLTVTREKERHCWLHYLSSALPAWKIFIGKGLPYFLVTFFNYSLLLWFSTAFLNLKIEGSLGLILLLGLLFDLIITTAGFAISAYAQSSLTVTRFLLLLSVPIFLSSGFTWPAAYIPPLLNGLVRLLPYPWMADGFRLVTMKSLGAREIAPILIALAIMAILWVALAVSCAKRRQPTNIYRSQLATGFRRVGHRLTVIG